MLKYVNRWPYDRNLPEASDDERCWRVMRPEDMLHCGLERHRAAKLPHLGCIFHLPVDGPRPDPGELRERLEDAVRNGAKLWWACLKGAHLERAKLSGAQLQGATLQEAHLDDADLQWAELSGETNLVRADLRGAKLQHADLTEANIQRATLWGACLQKATLTDAYLEGADLGCRHKLPGADLTGAHLSGARISPDTNLDDVTWGHRAALQWPKPYRRHVLEIVQQTWRWYWSSEYVIRLETEAEKREDHTEPARVYQRAMVSYQTWGHHHRAGEFFFRMMECKRKRARGAERAWLTFLLGLCGYGERPLWTALYLAIASSTLLVCGGSWRDASTWLMAFLISLFVVVFARRFQR